MVHQKQSCYGKTDFFSSCYVYFVSLCCVARPTSTQQLRNNDKQRPTTTFCFTGRALSSQWEEEKIRICNTTHIEGAVWSPYHPA